MKTKRNGGHFGAVSMAQAQRFIAAFAPDYRIEQARTARASYIVRDSFRGMTFTGATPRKAMQAAGVHFIAGVA